MAAAFSSMRRRAIAASWVRKRVVRLLEEVDLGKHHSCEVSDTVENDDAGGCIMEDYFEEGTRRDHFCRARGHCGLNERMMGFDDRKN